ncbi:hypothetical protein ACFL2Q_02575 [Thermodesulfobacteriota bacterium]
MAFPYGLDGDTLLIAMADPLGTGVDDMIAGLDMDVKVTVAPWSDVVWALETSLPHRDFRFLGGSGV